MKFLDFTLTTYKKLLDCLQSKSSDFHTYRNSVERLIKKGIVLRHDVDDKVENSLQFAKIEYTRNISGTYYFRNVPGSFNERVIREVANLNHEIGYHYETMDSCRGNLDKAYDEFCQNLESFRKLAPISTICMHGSPLSKFDNKAIWGKYNYKDLGIIAEPYLEKEPFNYFYLTDTGRCWDGELYNLRDKIPTQNKIISKIHSTFDIIKIIENDLLPDKVMLTIHPQRWNEDLLPWMQELILQNIKNVGKYFLLKIRNN